MFAKGKAVVGLLGLSGVGTTGLFAISPYFDLHGKQASVKNWKGRVLQTLTVICKGSDSKIREQVFVPVKGDEVRAFERIKWRQVTKATSTAEATVGDKKFNFASVKEFLKKEKCNTSLIESAAGDGGHHVTFSYPSNTVPECYSKEKLGGWSRAFPCAIETSSMKERFKKDSDDDEIKNSRFFDISGPKYSSASYEGSEPQINFRIWLPQGMEVTACGDNEGINQMKSSKWAFCVFKTTPSVTE